MALTKVTGQGLETLSDGVTITVADNSDVLSLVSTDADAASGPGLEFYRNSASGATSDFGGKISFYMEDANSDKIRTVAMFTRMSDATNGSEDGELYITTMTAGTERDKLHIYPTETVFNEDSVDQDFRVETDGNTHALFIEGSTDNISMGGSDTTPGAGTDARLNIITKNGGQSALVCFNAGTGATNVISLENGNGVVGRIQIANSATSYLTSSDYRLKQNVDYTWDATTRLKQLKPARFNFITAADTIVDGFLAHEVSSVVPEAISGTKDEVDADGNPVHQGIDQSKLVPLLVKTIQELEARITALESA